MFKYVFAGKENDFILIIVEGLGEMVVYLIKSYQYKGPGNIFSLYNVKWPIGRLTGGVSKRWIFTWLKQFFFISGCPKMESE